MDFHGKKFSELHSLLFLQGKSASCPQTTTHGPAPSHTAVAVGSSDLVNPFGVCNCCVQCRGMPKFLFREPEFGACPNTQDGLKFGVCTCNTEKNLDLLSAKNLSWFLTSKAFIQEWSLISHPHCLPKFPGVLHANFLLSRGSSVSLWFVSSLSGSTRLSAAHKTCLSQSLVPKRMDPPSPNIKTKIKAKTSSASTPLIAPSPRPSPQGWWRWEIFLLCACSWRTMQHSF